MKSIQWLLVLLLLTTIPALATVPDASTTVTKTDSDIYIVTSHDTFVGLSAIAAEATPVRNRSGTALILARTNAAGVDVLARYVHEQEGRCGGFFAFASRAEAETFLANDRSAEAIARPMAGIYTIDNAATVQPWLPQVQESNIYDTIDSLSNSFQNRHYQTTHGYEAALWIRDTWQALAAGYPGASVALFENCSNCGGQPSVILTVPGSDLADEVVVVGGHLDSINWNDPYDSEQRAPGADDDASGVATTTEIIRIALASGWKPRRTVEFHAYAAEEVGLNGSKAIAGQYQSSGVDVVAMLQLDMTNYKDGAPHDIQIISDNSNNDLLAFFRQLFDTYLAPLGMARRNVACGYGCSDHASWNARGFPAGMIFEAGRPPQNPVDMADFPYIHTEDDTLAMMNDSAQYSVPFAQFGLAFIGELGKTTPTGIFSDDFESKPSPGPGDRQ